MNNLQRATDGPDSPAMPAVIYAAKSTEDRRESIPDQLRRSRAQAEAAGREVVAEFSDEAASAFTGDRGPGLVAAKARAVQLAGEHGAAEMWVLHSDRLARGDGLVASHLVEHLLWARKAGVRLRAVEDDSTFDDLIRAVLMGERNHEDSARKAAATAAGLRRAAERGEWVGGICPDGYRVLRSVDERGRVSKRVELDPERADIYRLHFALAAAGHSDRAIVLALDERGYRTRPLKTQHRARPFDANRVRQTLTNAFYAGKVVHRGEVIADGHWPALVSWEDFERIRDARRARSHAGKAPAKGRPPEGYVLARVAACKACGSPMDVVTGRKVRKDGSRKRTYVCRTHRERPQDCAAKPIDAGVVDRAFVSNLTGFLGDVEGWRGQLIATREAERARMAQEVERGREDAAKCERILEAAQRRYAGALDAGDDERAAAIEEMIAGQRVERTRAQTRLAAAQTAFEAAAGVEDVDPLLDFYNGLSAELAGRVEGARGDVKRLNAAVQEFFERVELTHEDGGVRILPILSLVAADRILRHVEHWPHEVEAWVNGLPARVRRGSDDADDELRLVTPVTAENLHDVLSLTKPSTEITGIVRVSSPPAILASGAETLPPLRAIQAPDANAPAPW